jgi:hypothetical protein
MSDTNDINNTEVIGDSVYTYFRSGFTSIRPIEDNDKIPLFCPICAECMTSGYDDSYYRNYTCCYECATIWAEPDRERWKLGYRPDHSEIENELKIRRARCCSFSF